MLPLAAGIYSCAVASCGREGKRQAGQAGVRGTENLR